MNQYSCLILGGAGFMGSHLIETLLRNGHKVSVFDKGNVNKINIAHCLNQINFIEGDFSNQQDIHQAIQGIDIVFHLISTTLPAPSNENPAYDVKTNVIGTLNLLEAATDNGVKKIIFPSSGGTVYGIPERLPIDENHATNPICSYGITKLTIEKYLNLYHKLKGLNYSVLRIGNPFGERQRIDSIQGVINVFLGKVYRGDQIVIWGDGSVARDYLYIQDLIKAFVKVMDPDLRPMTLNIAGGHSYTLLEIILIMEQVTGKKIDIRFTPNRNLDVPVNCLDIGLAEKMIDWKPEISLDEGIRRTWQWIQTF